MIDPRQRVAALVVDAARDAVTRYAPEELEVFDAVAADWRVSPARRPSAPGSAIGFGIDASLVSELFLQAISAATTEVLVLGAAGLGSGIRAGWRRRRSAGRTPADPAAVTGSPQTGPAPSAPDPAEAAPAAQAVPDGHAPAGGPARSTGPLELTDEQAARLHEACRRHALALGLPPEAADLLADATVGAMVAPVDR
ncbi:hypothetical protein [Micromonospora sp. NPDC092111]|uniref:hypothetical protein n=1 Tax=Micromonospora sp. NPDC092111 TaxID=3364289 RepID=UPI003813BB63